MQEFLILLRGDGLDHLSPTELQEMLGAYSAWVEELGDNYLGGQRLENSGSFLKDKQSVIKTDGPFLESKEIIAGFFMIQAESIHQANDMASKLPHLGLYTLEIRPIAYPKMK